MFVDGVAVLLPTLQISEDIFGKVDVVKLCTTEINDRHASVEWEKKNKNMLEFSLVCSH
jgi:hypothetical protein